MIYSLQKNGSESDHESDHASAEEGGKPLFSGQKEWVRGFNSSFVRTLKGAEEYHLGSTGWDDFVRQSGIEEDNEEEKNALITSGLGTPEMIAMLVAASNTVELEAGSEHGGQSIPTATATTTGTATGDVFAQPDVSALSALADIASQRRPDEQNKSVS